MSQVHKENLTHVENAIPGRQGLELEIFGMEGVPAEIIELQNQQVTQKHFAEEQERARITGNPVRGQYANGAALPNKRPKVTESLEEIEARADKFRHDRKNGILPVQPVVEPVQNPVGLDALKMRNPHDRQLTNVNRHHQPSNLLTAPRQPSPPRPTRHNHPSPPPMAPYPRDQAAYPGNLERCPHGQDSAHRLAASPRAPTPSKRHSTTSSTRLPKLLHPRRRRKRRRAKRTRISSWCFLMR